MKHENIRKLYDVANGKVSNYDKMGKLLNLLFYIGFAVYIINLCYCLETKYRLCGDPDCKSKISEAVTLRDYSADSPEKVSFRAREDVSVYSKPKDAKGNLWEVQTSSGKKGFAPKEFLSEGKLLVKKNDLLEVPYKTIKDENIEPKIAITPLNSSIAVNATETTTTAPLPNDPKNVVTSHEKDEAILETPSSSPVLYNGAVVDGTQVPQDVYENAEGKENEIKVGDNDVSENSIDISDTGINERTVGEDKNLKNDTVQDEPLADKENNRDINNSGIKNSASNPTPAVVPPQDKSVSKESPGDTLDMNTSESGQQNGLKETGAAVDPEVKENENISLTHQKTEEDQLNSTETNVYSESPQSAPDNIKKNLNTAESHSSIDPELGQNESRENNDTLGIIGSNDPKTTSPLNSFVPLLLKNKGINENKDGTKNQQSIQSTGTEVSEKSEADGINDSLNVTETQANVEDKDPERLKREIEKSQSTPEAGSNDSSNVTEAQLNVAGKDQERLKQEIEKSQTTPEAEDINDSSNATEAQTNVEGKDPEGLKGEIEKSQTAPEDGINDTSNVTETRLNEQEKVSTVNKGNGEHSLERDNTNNVEDITDSVQEAVVSKNAKDINESGEANERKETEKPQNESSENHSPGAIGTKKAEQHATQVEDNMQENIGNSEDSQRIKNYFSENVNTQDQDMKPKNEISLEIGGNSEESTTQGLKESLSNEVFIDDVASQETHTTAYPEETSETTISPEHDVVIDTPEILLKDSSVIENNHQEGEIHQENENNQNVVAEKHIHEGDNKSHEDTRDVANSEYSRNLPEENITTEKVKNNWFFSNVFDTVKNFWSSISKHELKEEEKFDDDLDKILFPDKSHPDEEESLQQHSLPEDAFCEKLTPNSCPTEKNKPQNAMLPHTHNINSVHMCSSEKDFFSSLNDKILEMVDLLACLLITAFTVLIFCFGYYYICHSRKERALLSKLNCVERSLLASNKERAKKEYDLLELRKKLDYIKDNSFESNDMVVALKQELDESEEMKLRLQEQVTSLEKELENAAEAGLELNKIVSELLSNQSGDDSIISSVEELQKQLNEQQNTILQINAALAEKSRENSELQLILTNQSAKFQEELQNLKQQNEDLQNDKILLKSKLEESEKMLQKEISKAADEKRLEIQRLGKEMAESKEKYYAVHKKLQASEARVQVLEECLHGVKNNAKFNIKELIDAVNLKTEVLAIRRERDSLKERLEGEMDARKLLEDHVKIISEEVSNLKQEYNQSEKEKVEAKTRLEVLSSYFKEKETQLQKELSLKEAMWLKQQGETSSTVERVRLMQDEIQALKSQNDSLRAEIEAQAATHRAQIANLENRAHETWLTARQSERKLEEARIESTALRRKLTSMAGNLPLNEANSQNRLQNTVDGVQNDVNNAPSPVHIDTPGSPLIGGLPPPLPFLPPPPFMAAPHPFMPMPPPFMPPGEMRPPPLGRLMSPPPPPPHDRYSPSIVDDRDRYSPPNGRYSPNNRYNYNTDIMSNYDTETDFSPPPSPGARAGGGNGGCYSSRERDRGRERNSRSYKPFSPPPLNNSDRNKKSKGILSSGSADSYDSRKSKGKGKV